mgnify:FL=1
MFKRLIVDMSSLCWTYLLKGKDTEFGIKVEHNGRTVDVNSAQYGYDQAIDLLTSVMEANDIPPYNVVLVLEGKNSKSRRQALCPGYKSGRDSRPPEAYEQFNLMKQRVCDALNQVGATVATQDGVEGDDVIAFLCKELDGEKLILSNDNDLCRLLTPQVSQYRMGTMLTFGDNPKGPFDSQFITLEKALVGGHDDLKGAIGFGETAWKNMLVWAPHNGVLKALEGMIVRKKLHELVDDIPAFPPLKKIMESAETVYQSYAASKLYPEWVNTVRQPLSLKAGMTAMLDQVEDERLRKWAQKTRLITAANYDEAVKHFKAHLDVTPWFALDIESSTPDESDEWLSAGNRDDKVDVFGQDLVSCAITFGSNGQFTFYFSVRHADTDNLTSEQLRKVVAMIPRDKVTLVQNAGFELSVLYQEWAEKQKDNGFYGFLPNVRDTKIYASYVNENLRLGLKDRSKHHLGYTQVSYTDITTLTGHERDMPKGGRLLNREMERVVERYEQQYTPVQDERGNVTMVPTLLEPVFALDANGEPLQVATGIITKQYKMHELSGAHVLPYGADDTICTYALAVHFGMVMEIEKTWDLCEEIETYPAYVTALGFLQGTNFDLQQMLEQEAEDEKVWAKSWAVLRDWLIANGWPGTVCPQIIMNEAAPKDAKLEHWQRDWSPKTIKELTKIVLDLDLVTQVRTINKLGKLVASLDHDDAPLLGKYIEDGNIDQLNELIKANFKGEPTIDLGSPKSQQALLYDFMKLPVRLVNPLSEGERAKAYNRPPPGRAPYTQEEVNAASELANAVSRFNKIRAGSQSEAPLTAAELALVRTKARTDETVLDFALFFDQPDHPALLAIKQMKTIETRQNLFYKPYRHFRHWKDNKIHASANQCQAVTRRWSFTDPNLTQLPKRGDGAKFRRNFKPHHRDAVVVSVDFASQEIRLQAGLSMDPQLLSCYLGDRPRDFHCITASGAMRVVWKATEIAEAVGAIGSTFEDDYDQFMAIYKGNSTVWAKKAKDLRGLCKSVNFGSSYGCAAPKMQELLVCEFDVAENLLNTKLEVFSRYEEWKAEVEEQAMRDGMIRTELGGIRHLQDVVRKGDKWEMVRAARQASNFKIQSAGAELAKKALTRLWKSGVFFKLDAVFFAVIHDEVVASVHKDHAVEFIKILHNAISQPYTPDFAVPFVGSISVGPTLGDQVELGESVDEAAIEAVLDQMFSNVNINGATRRFVDWTEKYRLNYNDVLNNIEKGKDLPTQVMEKMEKVSA